MAAAHAKRRIVSLTIVIGKQVRFFGERDAEDFWTVLACGVLRPCVPTGRTSESCDGVAMVLQSILVAAETAMKSCFASIGDSMTTTLLSKPETSSLSRQEVIDTYPDVSPLIILKTDLQRRSVVYTERALAALDPERHQVQINGWTDSALIDHQYLPVSLLLRDGTSVLVGPRPGAEDPMSSTVSTAAPWSWREM